jgi:hypothetical protein
LIQKSIVRSGTRCSNAMDGVVRTVVLQETYRSII